MFVGGVRVCVSRESEWKEEVHSKREKQREGGGGEEREMELSMLVHASIWKSLHCSLSAEVRKTVRG